MLLSSNINYDNTYKTMIEAKQNSHLLNIPSGSEKQLYNIGDQVITSEHATQIIKTEDNAKIVDTYIQNGYFYYVIEYSRLKAKCKNKLEKITNTFRQKDLIKL